MKRIICALLSVVLLVGCRNASPVSDSDNTWMMNFPDLQWGMTPEEVCEALSLKESDYDSYSDSFLVLGHVRMPLFNGEDASVTFMFDNQNGDEAFTLFHIEVLYPSGTDMECVRDTMTQYYGEPAEADANKAIWNSTANYRDIMTEEDISFVQAQYQDQPDFASKILNTPITTVSWTTNSYPVYQLDGTETHYMLMYDSAYSFYVSEGGYTSLLEVG